MSRLISRDPFARTELHRTTVTVEWATCKNCGSVNKPTGSRGQYIGRKLFRYHTEHDGGRRDDHPGLFCSVGCFRCYNGL